MNVAQVRSTNMHFDIRKNAAPKQCSQKYNRPQTTTANIASTHRIYYSTITVAF